MKVLKRVLAGFMCAVIMVATTVSAFADNPLQLSDHLTQRAQKAQERREGINNARSAQYSTQSAYTKAGINSDMTDELSFYLNRKYMTKAEYDAFKWSFIFSQFARPMQDSLLDVFGQEFFTEMTEQDFNITSVMETLQEGGLNPNTDKILEAMLSSVNFTTLRDTIQKNYTTYALVDAAGNTLTLGDLVGGSFDIEVSDEDIQNAAVDEALHTPTGVTLVTGGQNIKNAADNAASQVSHATAYGNVPIFKKYYIWDTRVVTNDTETANALLYNQEILGDPNFEQSLKYIGTPEPYLLPVFIYDSQTALYLQLALVAFIRTNSEGLSTNAEVLARYGNSQMVIDSFGNICAMEGDKACVVIPNFGNPYLTAKEGKSSSLTETINFYNGWITAFYTRNQRAGQTIYGNPKLLLAIPETKKKGDVYSSAVVKSKTGSLGSSIMLVEPSNVYHAYQTEYVSKSSYGVTPATVTSMGDAKWSVTDKPFNYKIMGYDIGSKIKSSQIFPSTWTTAVVGTLISPYNSEQEYFAPFTATNKETFENTHPLVTPNIDVIHLNSSSNAGYTSLSRMIDSMTNSQWRFTYDETPNAGSGEYGKSHSKFAPFSLPVANPSNLAVLVTSFSPQEVISDSRFISTYKGDLSACYRSEMFLPEEILDLGQNMNAYIDNEKGMLLADYNYIFSGTSSDLKRMCDTIAACMCKDPTEFGAAKDHNDKYFVVSNEAGGDNDGFHDAIWKEGDKVHTDVFFPIKYTGDAGHFFMGETSSFWESVAGAVTLNDKGQVADYGDELEISTYCYWDNPYPSGSVKQGEQSVFDQQLAAWIAAKAAAEKEGKSFTDPEPCNLRAYYYPTQCISPGKNKSTLPITWKADSKEPTDGYILPNLSDSGTQELVAGELALDTFIALAVYIDAYSESGNSKANPEAGNTLLNALDGFAREAEVDFYDLVALLCCFAKYNGADGNANNTNNMYFYDEYWYYIRNIANLSPKIGASNSGTFATAVYYWDRYYLTNSALNKSVTQKVKEQWDKVQKLLDAYDKYLLDYHLTKNDCSFETYVTQKAPGTHKINYMFNSYNLFTPYFYENKYQTTTLEQFKKDHEGYDKIGEDALLYEYLDDNTIIIYPFFSSSGKTTIDVYAGLGDSFYNMDKVSLDQLTNNVANFLGANGNTSSSLAVVRQSATSCYEPWVTMLALQKNTDYRDNPLVECNKRVDTKPTVTKEGLMENAQQFFDNPVTSLSYILTGFLYKIHDTVATGNLGNVFSASWLTETKPYKWIMDRYIALMTIAVVVMLALKLTQLAMSKERNYAAITRSLVGIAAMGMVPVVIFNSFIWTFDKTSEWALKDPYNKVLLSRVDKVTAQGNSDAAVDTEITVFKEQFNSIHGEETSPTLEIMSSYTYGSGPQYDTCTVDTLVSNVKYLTTYKDWYSKSQFKNIHQAKYNETLFYYFYDYIRAEFFNYLTTSKPSTGAGQSGATGNSGIYSAVVKLDKDVNSGGNWDNPEFQKIISADEDMIHTMTGGAFRSMLMDTEFVYGASADDADKTTYQRPFVKDLVGLSNIFMSSYDIEHSSTYMFKDNTYLKAYRDAKPLVVDTSRAKQVCWDEDEVAYNYLVESVGDENKLRSLRAATANRTTIATSYLDLYDPDFNPRASAVTPQNYMKLLTPFEKSLCDLSEDIYETTLKCLNYLPDQIHDEAAVTMMALVATFKTSQLFGYEPSGPVIGTVSLDDVIRAAFVNNLQEVAGESNTLYAMIQQGDSMGRVFLVVVLEVIICVASVARIFLILYITGATFVILGLRVMNKTPKTNDLLYGIVGNLLALLFMHALTLFLVVVAVEWVAGATSAIPGLVLDIAMVLFIILMVFLLVKLVKNIILDAVNIGGMKIRSMIHRISDAVIHAAGKLFHRGNSQAAADTVNLDGNINESAESSAQQAESERVRETRRRAESILGGIESVEAAEQAQAAPKVTVDTKPQDVTVHVDQEPNVTVVKDSKESTVTIQEGATRTQEHRITKNSDREVMQSRDSKGHEREVISPSKHSESVTRRDTSGPSSRNSSAEPVKSARPKSSVDRDSRVQDIMGRNRATRTEDKPKPKTDNKK